MTHRRRPGCVMLAVLIAALPALAVAAPLAAAHSDTCDVSKETQEIQSPSLAEHPSLADEGTSLTEEVYLTTEDSTVRGAVNGLDAYIKDLRCHIGNATYSVSGQDANDLATLRVRFYDHFGELTGHTADCATSHSGSVPDGTQYIAVVPCEGAPLNMDGIGVPYTVEITLDVEK